MALIRPNSFLWSHCLKRNHMTIWQICCPTHCAASTWSPAMIFCMSTRVKTLTAVWLAVSREVRLQSASRAAGTASSWHSAVTPRLGCPALPLSTKVCTTLLSIVETSLFLQLSLDKIIQRYMDTWTSRSVQAFCKHLTQRWCRTVWNLFAWSSIKTFLHWNKVVKIQTVLAWHCSSIKTWLNGEEILEWPPLIVGWEGSSKRFSSVLHKSQWLCSKI